MNKKAQFELRKIIYWTIMMAVITVIIFLFALQLWDFQNSISKYPPELKAELVALRFANSPDCFADQVSGRVYPGIIDLAKFSQENLFKCYPVDDKKEFQFGLELKKAGKKLRTKKYYLNNRDFTITKSVLVKDGEKITPDLLEIGVQIKI